MKILFEAFLDWNETIEDIIAEGDKVWHRFNCTGIHNATCERAFRSDNKKVFNKNQKIIDLRKIYNRGIYNWGSFNLQ